MAGQKPKQFRRGHLVAVLFLGGVLKRTGQHSTGGLKVLFLLENAEIGVELALALVCK